MHTLKATDIDAACLRLEELEAGVQAIRAELLEQVLQYGIIPPRAEKSKRLCGELYQLTVSTSTSVELKEAAILAIREVCQLDLFERLFRSDVITRWRLVEGATMLLAGVLPEGAPRNLRVMFNRALTVKENAPRLKIERRTGAAEDITK